MPAPMLVPSLDNQVNCRALMIDVNPNVRVELGARTVRVCTDMYDSIEVKQDWSSAFTVKSLPPLNLSSASWFGDVAWVEREHRLLFSCT